MVLPAGGAQHSQARNETHSVKIFGAGTVRHAEAFADRQADEIAATVSVVAAALYAERSRDAVQIVDAFGPFDHRGEIRGTPRPEP